MNLTRRDMLKWSGAAIGTAALGPRVSAEPSDELFILDVGDRVTKRDVAAAERVDLRVLSNLEEIGYLRVTGRTNDVKKLGYEWSPDLKIDDAVPAPAATAPANGRVPEDVPEAEFSEPLLYGLQWDKQRQNLPQAIGENDGSGARVAIIDSGVDHLHPDLQANVNETLSRNFTLDSQGAPGPYGGYHGSHVAGITAARGNQAIGTAPRAEIVDARVFSTVPESQYVGQIAEAILYSTNQDCDVANMSIGWGALRPENWSSLLGVLKDMYGDATAYARANGTLLVNSAGNAAMNLSGPKIDPLPEAPNMVTVSATGPIGFNQRPPGLEKPETWPANYTNVGAKTIDIGAPGGNYDPAQPTGWYYDLVFNTIPEVSTNESNQVEDGWGHTYSWVAGTSMAAPQVTGAAALVRAENPGYTPEEVYAVLMSTAEGASAEGYSPKTHGHGFLRPDLAVKADADTVATGSGRGPSSGRGARSGRGSGGSSTGEGYGDSGYGSGGSRGRGSGRGNQSGRS